MLFYSETHCWREGASPHMALFLSQVKVIAEDQAEWEDKVFVSEPFSQPPPLATTSCSIEDRGNHTQHRPPSENGFCIPSIIWCSWIFDVTSETCLQHLRRVETRNVQLWTCLYLKSRKCQSARHPLHHLLRTLWRSSSPAQPAAPGSSGHPSGKAKAWRGQEGWLVQSGQLQVGSVLTFGCDSRSPCKCAWSHSAWRGVDGVEPSCVQPWAGWTVARGSTAPSVINSLKVSSRTENVKKSPLKTTKAWSPNLQFPVSVEANHQSSSVFRTLQSMFNLILKELDKIFKISASFTCIFLHFLFLSAMATLPAHQRSGGGSSG